MLAFFVCYFYGKIGVQGSHPWHLGLFVSPMSFEIFWKERFIKRNPAESCSLKWYSNNISYLTFVVGTVSLRLRDGKNLKCSWKSFRHGGQIFDDLSNRGNAGLELFTVAMEAQCCDAALPDYSQIEGPLAVTFRLVLLVLVLCMVLHVGCNYCFIVPLHTAEVYEKPVKVLMKESLCEALFFLESCSELWKAIWLNTKSDTLQYLEIQL